MAAKNAMKMQTAERTSQFGDRGEPARPDQDVPKAMSAFWAVTFDAKPLSSTGNAVLIAATMKWQTIIPPAPTRSMVRRPALSVSQRLRFGKVLSGSCIQRCRIHSSIYPGTVQTTLTTFVMMVMTKGGLMSALLKNVVP